MSWEKIDAVHIRGVFCPGYSDMDILNRFVSVNEFDTIHSYWQGYAIKNVLAKGAFSGMPSDKKNDPPHLDHSKLFKSSKTGVCCLTYNPYESAESIRSEIEQWAINNDLEAEIYDSAYSWYYPHHTCFVVIHLPGDTIYVD